MPSGAVARATQLLDPGARREEFVWFDVALPHGAVIEGTTIRHDLVGGFLLVDRADDMLQRGFQMLLFAGFSMTTCTSLAHASAKKNAATSAMTFPEWTLS